jgi:parallel beta-helix repeat protein
MCLSGEPRVIWGRDELVRNAFVAISLLLMSVFVSALSIQLAKTEKTIIVPDDYPTIQDAINAASDGDAIFVRNGTYHENIVIDKSVRVLGENRNSTIITGNYVYEQATVTVIADDVQIREFTVQDGWCGVTVQSSACTIADCRVTENRYRGGGGQIYETGRGIWVRQTTNATVTGNVMNSNDRGLSLEDAQDSNVTSNTILDSPVSWGLILEASNRNTIENNTVKHSAYDGIYFAGSSDNIVVGNSVEANGDEGLYLGSSQNNSIIGNHIVANPGEGIWLDWSNGSTVLENNVIGNGKHGILASYADNTKVYHNTFYDNALGQAYSNMVNVWDDDYPSGGNYWGDYLSNDIYSGPFQNETGSDGIGDTARIIDTDNRDNYPLMNPYSPPDIAVTNVTSTKTVIGKGYTGTVSVTFGNLDNKIQAFSFTVYANSTVVCSEQIIVVTSYTVSFKWNTTSSAYGNYTITAYAEPLPEEANTFNNNVTCAIPVHVGVPADISGSTPGAYNYVTDMKDIAYLIAHFMGKPSNVRWDPNGDVNDDNIINMRDIAIAVAYFNNREPYP